MEIKNKFILISLGIILAPAVILLFWNPPGHYEQTKEARLMRDLCNEVASSETLRAQDDFNKLIELISVHIHQYVDNSNETVARAVMELRALQNEAEFRTVDVDMYHRKFARILVELAQVELEDAIGYEAQHQVYGVKKSVREAKHYLHDALIFSRTTSLSHQKELEHEFEKLSISNVSNEQIRNCIAATQKVVS